MTTRISQSGPEPRVAHTPTASRVTPAPGEPFRAVMQASARAVITGAEAAVERLPGGPVLAAAFRSEPVASTSQGLSAEGSAGTAGSVDATTGSPNDSGIDGVMAESASQNMYFLQLQQQISAENRQYTALSNVLKARHDTLKNAIGNIR